MIAANASIFCGVADAQAETVEAHVSAAAEAPQVRHPAERDRVACDLLQRSAIDLERPSSGRLVVIPCSYAQDMTETEPAHSATCRNCDEDVRRSSPRGLCGDCEVERFQADPMTAVYRDAAEGLPGWK